MNEVVGRAEGVGVVVAQDPAAAGEGVLVEGTSLLVLAQPGQVDTEVVGRAEGVGVVVAQDAIPSIRQSSAVGGDCPAAIDSAA